MTTIPWSMAKKIQKRIKEGYRIRCFEKIYITKAQWGKIIETLNIPNNPEWDSDSKKCSWKCPSKELELMSDCIPDENSPITCVEFYGAKEDLEIFLKATGFKEKG